MAGAGTDLLGLSAGFGRGFMDERKRRQELAAEARKMELQERQANAEISLADRKFGQEQSEFGLKQGEFDAEYGDKVVQGGLKKYGVDAPERRFNSQLDALMDNPEFSGPLKRMTPRDKQTRPYSSYRNFIDGDIMSSGEAGISPLDIANFRLDYLKGVMGGPAPLIAPKPEARDARADSMATELGIKPLLTGELSRPKPSATKGKLEIKKASTADSLKRAAKNVPGSNPREAKMMGAINSATESPEALLKELNDDYRRNPKAFEGVNMERLRAAIRAKKGKAKK